MKKILITFLFLICVNGTTFAQKNGESLDINTEIGVITKLKIPLEAVDHIAIKKDTLFFARKDQIYSYNLKTDEIHRLQSSSFFPMTIAELWSQKDNVYLLGLITKKNYKHPPGYYVFPVEAIASTKNPKPFKDEVFRFENENLLVRGTSYVGEAFITEYVNKGNPDKYRQLAKGNRIFFVKSSDYKKNGFMDATPIEGLQNIWERPGNEFKDMTPTVVPGIQGRIMGIFYPFQKNKYVYLVDESGNLINDLQLPSLQGKPVDKRFKDLKGIQYISSIQIDEDRNVLAVAETKDLVIRFFSIKDGAEIGFLTLPSFPEAIALDKNQLFAVLSEGVFQFQLPEKLFTR